MSDGYQEIGRLDAIDGSALVAGKAGDRMVLGFATPGRQMIVVDLGAEAWDALRELLDRAAMPGQPAPASGERMAVDEHGKLRPVSEFAPDEKWWCEGEDCGGARTDPHVHPLSGPALAVDLLTGRETEAHAGAAARTTAGEDGGG